MARPTLAIVRRRAATWRARRRRSCGRRPARTWRRAASWRRRLRDLAARLRPAPARNAAPMAVVSGSVGRCTVTPSWSAWNCSRPSITDAPPSTRSSRSGCAAGPHHRLDRITGLERHRLDDGPRQVAARGAAGDPDDRAPGVGVPPRRPEPGEGGHDEHARRCRRRWPPAARSRPPRRSRRARRAATGSPSRSRRSTLRGRRRRRRRPASTPRSSAGPRPAAGRSAPTFISTKLPVPYVFLAIPGSTQA